MIKVEENAFWRGGVKIGYIEDRYIFDNSGKKVGYCDNEHVYDKNGRKLASLIEDYIDYIDTGRKIRIEDNNRDVVGGSLNNIQRAAARILLGE